MVRFGLVGSGVAVKAVKARQCVFWCGPVRRGAAWQGGSGMLGSGKLDYGMAVGVWFGEARSVLAVGARYGWAGFGEAVKVWFGEAWRCKAVKLTNKWWAVVAHYTNIRNFLEDSICLVLIRRPSSVS